MVRRLTLLLALFLLTGGVAQAAEPPNQNDPCAKAGRNTCGTNGEGSYRNYRYGIRWFGDYRGAVEDVTGGDVLHRPAVLVPVEVVRLREALGGRPQEQGRRRGLGDEPAPDEPRAVALRALQQRRAAGRGDDLRAPADGRRRAGRGRSEGALVGEPVDLREGRQRRGALRRALQGQGDAAGQAGRRPGGPADRRGRHLERAARAERGRQPLRDRRRPALPDSVSTGSSGVVKAPITGTDPAGGIKLDATAASLPDVLPTLYVAHQGPVGAQRAADRPGGGRQAERQAPGARPGPAGAGDPDQPAVRGGGRGDHGHGQGHGPRRPDARRSRPRSTARTPRATRSSATDTPVWTGTIQATGDGDYVTAPVKLDTPGYYTYRESIAESDTIAGVQTACAEASETTIIRGAPSDHHPGERAGDRPRRADHRRGGGHRPRQALRDGQRRAVGAVPDPRRDHLRGHAVLDRDVPGHRRRHLHDRAGHAARRPATTPTASRSPPPRPSTRSSTDCGEASETTIAKAAPQVTTSVSDAVVRPDAQLSDTLNVTGLGKTPATVEVELYGPVRVTRGHRLRRRAVLEGHGRTSTGDGTYTTEKATVRRVGFYVFREKIAATETVAGHQARVPGRGRDLARRARRSSAAAATTSPTSPRAAAGRRRSSSRGSASTRRSRRSAST